MRYFKDINGTLHGIEDDQLHLITEDMRELTLGEFKQYITPKERDTDVWDADLEQWVDGRTVEQLLADEIATLPALSAKDFRHMLDRAGLRDDIELLITQIEDPQVRRAIQNEYEYAQFFERTHPAVLYMMKLLELDDERVNTEWKTPISLDQVLPGVE